MPSSRYHQSSLGSQPSESFSMASVDDPPPPPPPRRKKTSSSSRHRSKGTSFDTSLPSIESSDAPQSRFEDENDSRNSRDHSHASSRSSPRRKSSGRRTGSSRDKEITATASSDFSHHSNGSGHNSFAAPPPPPPPGNPPPNRRSKRDGLGRIPEEDNVSRGSRSTKSTSRRTPSKKSQSREDTVSRNDSESVDTEVLRFGGDGESAADSTSKSSVAERRRKKAEAKKKALVSTSKAKKVDKKSTEKSFEDPPLELYSESESDESDYGADKSISKKGKKSVGITRVKSLIQMGVSHNMTYLKPRSLLSSQNNHLSTSQKSSPEKKKSNTSPTRSVKSTKSDGKKKLSPSRSGAKTTISPGRRGSLSSSGSPEKKKKGGFLSRFSPGRKSKNNSPERQQRGREARKEDPQGRKSPFRFRSRSRSKTRGKDDSSNSKNKRPERTKKNSGEIVVNKAKLAEHEKKMNRAAQRSRPEVDDRSRASGKSTKSKHDHDAKSAASSISEKKESTFEKLRREREEKKQIDDDRKKSEFEHSGMEFISDENSDDVSEMTDPTYMTKRDEKRRSPVNGLHTVKEDFYSSPENSPRSRKEESKGENKYDDYRKEEEESLEFSQSRSRSESPNARSTKSKNSKISNHSEFSDKSRPGYKEKSPDDENDGNDWNPKTFPSEENFVATIDPFKKAEPSKDPFDEPFYPSASNDEPKQMYSFVYSESDAELERGGFSKDTMTGLSFDSEEETNNDGISFATPADRSDVTEIVQNSLLANQRRSSRQMLPPGGEKKVRDAFLGIDENSGAVTLNVSPNVAQPKEQHRPVMSTGSLSQRALQRPKKSRGFLDHDYEEPGKIVKAATSTTDTPQQRSPAQSPYFRKLDQARNNSKSPERTLSHSPSFIQGRRERKTTKKAASERYQQQSPQDNFDLSRGKSNPSVARERGRRRENIFDNSVEKKVARTYSPDKMKFALNNDRDGSPTKTLGGSRIRSPQKPRRQRTPHGRDRERDSWFEKPQFSTNHLRSPSNAIVPQQSTRSVFKAPAVFGSTPREGSFRAPEPYSRRTDPVLASVAHIEDPIQRAGAMILSAAAIPIQAEMRRYLAVKHREDRTWAIVVVQSYFRRWRAELHRYKHLYCVTRVQAAFRGWLVRDTLEDKHYCATQIQKIARGYLATMSVYEDLYNITVVQSIARRNIAIKEAEKRYRSIVTIQALWRGLQCKRELNYLHWSATKIQSAWRGYTAKLNYQFDIVDIIIVQSIVRRRAAIQLVRNMRNRKVNEAATTIQKYWRSYDCTMNYLHCIADILIAQSVVRRWIAIRHVNDYRDSLYFEMSMRIQMCVRSWLARTRVKKERAARAIQKTWRGFWCYSDYVFTLADIIVVQKTVRGHQARKRAAIMAQQRDEQRQRDSAIMIQKTWRGYTAQMEMLFTLVHIIIVQVSFELVICLRHIECFYVGLINF